MPGRWLGAGQLYEPGLICAIQLSRYPGVVTRTAMEGSFEAFLDKQLPQSLDRLATETDQFSSLLIL